MAESGFPGIGITHWHGLFASAGVPPAALPALHDAAVGALGTVYALSATADNVDLALQPIIAASWGLPTALALLAWFVFAPQCLSTLATVKRETNSWRYPAIKAAYLFPKAYVAAFLTYRIALAVTA
jgi:ferrous iron transport protein B